MTWERGQRVVPGAVIPPPATKRPKPPPPPAGWPHDRTDDLTEQLRDDLTTAYRIALGLTNQPHGVRENDPVSTPAQQELRDLIRSKLTDDMTADQAADAVARLLHDVADDWDAIEIGTIADMPGTRTLDQRWLVARIPRESRERHLRPDRSVTP